MGNFLPKPKRSADWNYGGQKWRLSRSKLELFIECPRCFYLDNRLGVARPRGFPFNLNSAVDILLKKEFDAHRADKSAHPLMTKYGVDAVPFAHADLETWREVFKGIECAHAKSGLTVCGAVDDIWVNPAGELIVVDYKSTSKDEEVNLDAEWQDGYKRQMEIYQWLLRQKGFKVSDTGYFVYANGRRDRKAFDGKLEFDVTLIAHKGDDSWVEEAILRAKECLEGAELPKHDPYCDYCNYRKLALEVQAPFMKKSEVSKPAKEESKPKPKKNDKDDNKTDKLF